MKLPIAALRLVTVPPAALIARSTSALAAPDSASTTYVVWASEPSAVGAASSSPATNAAVVIEAWARFIDLVTGDSSSFFPRFLGDPF